MSVKPIDFKDNESSKNLRSNTYFSGSSACNAL